MAVQPGTIRPGSLLRPSVAADFLSKSTPARIGLLVAVVGIMVAMAAFVGSIVNAVLVSDDEGLLTGGAVRDDAILANTAWTFGVATLALAIIKSGIALILLGIVRRLWVRVESLKSGLPKLAPDAPDKAEISSSRISTPYGAATHTSPAPKPLLIHRMAYLMWSPMLLMGVMAVM